MKDTCDNMYNNDPVNDMEINYDFHINTGELSDIFNDDNLDAYINNLNDWD